MKFYFISFIGLLLGALAFFIPELIPFYLGMLLAFGGLILIKLYYLKQ